MFSILHITDLHRSKSDPISNAELISALVSDRDRYLHEDPPIAAPQAIIVSGDIIQGVRIGQDNYEAELRNQYDAAHEFLSELADVFLDGDRSKVVLVPGNHDIDWNKAFSAMSRVQDKDAPSDILRALGEPNSPYRWDWKSRQLYVITDLGAYRERMAPYWNFFERFYSGADGLLRVEPWSDANLYSLDGGAIGVAGFNSCVGNDCFANHGEISREVVARSHLDLQRLGPWRLRIAVWHHDVEGPPLRSDYMDPDIVRGMIGRGFSLGLYGHQHRPQITPQHAYLPERETMAISSAGSLCAGARELPTGARRGYSIIEIGDDYGRARVHVREMAFANLFSRANLATFGGRTYVDLGWTTPLDAAGRPETPVRARRVALIERAEEALLKDNNPSAALNLLREADVLDDPFGRRLALSAAVKTGDPSQIIEIVKQPGNIEELVLGVDAYLASEDYEAAEIFLFQHGENLHLPNGTRDDMMNRINLIRRTQ